MSCGGELALPALFLASVGVPDLTPFSGAIVQTCTLFSTVLFEGVQKTIEGNVAAEVDVLNNPLGIFRRNCSAL